MRTSPRLAAVFASLSLASSLAGCSLFATRADYEARQQAAVAQARTGADDQVSASLEKARRSSVENPGSVEHARVFAQNVAGAFELGVVERKELDGAGLLREAGAALDKAGAEHAESLPEIEFSRGGMLLSAGKTDEAVSAWRASMAAKPSPRACVALIAELDKQGDLNKEIPGAVQVGPAQCREADETHFALLDGCARHGHDATLAWAGPEGARLLQGLRGARIAEENEARRAEEDRRAAARRAEDDARRAERNAGSNGSSSADPPPRQAAAAARGRSRSRTTARRR